MLLKTDYNWKEITGHSKGFPVFFLFEISIIIFESLSCKDIRKILFDSNSITFKNRTVIKTHLSLFC